MVSQVLCSKKMKNKKPLYIALVTIDVAIILFLLIVSVIMLIDTGVRRQQNTFPDSSTFIGYLQTHTLFYLLVFVVPLFILLAANIIGLVVYVKRSTQKKKITASELSAEDKKALLAELLKEEQDENSK